MFPTGLATSHASPTAAAAAYPTGIYPYGAQLPQGLAMSTPNMVAAAAAGGVSMQAGTIPTNHAAAASMMMPTAANMGALQQAAGLTHLSQRAAVPGAAAAATAGYPYSQPILYWYPSPPVSPQSTPYYMHGGGPATVMMKGR